MGRDHAKLNSVKITDKPDTADPACKDSENLSNEFNVVSCVEPKSGGEHLLPNTNYINDLNWFRNSIVSDVLAVLLVLLGTLWSIVSISSFGTGKDTENAIVNVCLLITIVFFFIFKMVRMPRKLRQQRLEFYHTLFVQDPDISLEHLASSCKVKPDVVLKDLQYCILHKEKNYNRDYQYLIQQMHLKFDKDNCEPVQESINPINPDDSAKSIVQENSTFVRVNTLCTELKNINLNILVDELSCSINCLIAVLQGNVQGLDSIDGERVLDIYIENIISLLQDYNALSRKDPKGLSNLLQLIKEVSNSVESISEHQESLKELSFSSNAEVLLNKFRSTGL